VAGQSVPVRGGNPGEGHDHLRASTIEWRAVGLVREGTMALSGVLEESLFLGAHYGTMSGWEVVVVMADSPRAAATGPVRLVLPADRVQVYG